MGWISEACHWCADKAGRLLRCLTPRRPQGASIQDAAGHRNAWPSSSMTPYRHQDWLLSDLMSELGMGTMFPRHVIRDEGNDLRVEIELPGIDRKNIDVQLDQRMLTVYAERKDKHHRENRYNQITLPCDVAADRVHASYRDGLLDLRLPKARSSQCKKIPITKRP